MADTQPTLGLWDEPPACADKREDILRRAIWKLPLQEPERELLLGIAMLADRDWKFTASLQDAYEWVRSVKHRELQPSRRNSLEVLCVYGVLTVTRRGKQLRRAVVNIDVLQRAPAAPVDLYASARGQSSSPSLTPSVTNDRSDRSLFPVTDGDDRSSEEDDRSMTGHLTTLLAATWRCLTARGSPSLPPSVMNDRSTGHPHECIEVENEPHEIMHEVYEGDWNFTAEQVADRVFVRDVIAPLAPKVFKFPDSQAAREGVRASAICATEKGQSPPALLTSLVKNRAWENNQPGARLAEKYFDEVREWDAAQAKANAPPPTAAGRSLANAWSPDEADDDGSTEIERTAWPIWRAMTRPEQDAFAARVLSGFWLQSYESSGLDKKPVKSAVFFELVKELERRKPCKPNA